MAWYHRSSMSRRSRPGSRPGRSSHGGRIPRVLLQAGGGAALVGLLVGCMEPEPPRLVAQLGCNVDEGLIGTLRVQARGDFPPRGGTQVLFSGGDQNLAWGELPVVGVTVEGLFGQTVEAVGRTARLREEGDIPVYFAPVDGLCPVAGEVVARVETEVAVGPEGDVLAVGGRDAEGRLLDDVLHLYDEDGRVRRLPGALPLPLVGHSVHALGDRRFLVFGGAGGGEQALDQMVVVDLDDEAAPVGDPRPTGLSEAEGATRAFHAAAVVGQRVLIAGGCRRLREDVRCAALDGIEPDDSEAPDVPANAVWIDMEPGGPSITPGPDVVVPRFEADLLVGRDGVAFLAGGWDADGTPVHVVERYRPGTNRFRRYGGDLRSDLETDVPVVGAALHEGGVVLLALADGRIHWITETERDEHRPWTGWCIEQSDPCFGDLSTPAPATRRGLLVLPGERVLADGVVLPVAGIGRSGADAVDLFEPRPGAPVPPPARVGSVPVVLADGSVLMIGGHDPRTGLPASPLALRMRPDLDGADERIPELDRAARGSLIARDPERAVLEGDTLRLLGVDEITADFPRVRARARGFRSSSFRFEVTVQVTSGEVVPHLVLEHGAVQMVSVGLESGRVVEHRRDEQGVTQDLSCGSTGLDFDGAQVLRFDVRPDAILVRRGTEVLAECPVGGEPSAWSVALGAAGSGEMLVTGLRLTRQ